MAVFNSYLYTGTWQYVDGNAAQVWRMDDSFTWSEVTPSWSAENGAVFDSEVFDGNLYVGSANDNGAELWRTDGSTWEQIVSGGFDDANNTVINAMKVFSGNLYIATSNDTTGTEIWRSASGDVGSWTQVNTDGFGSAGTSQDVSMDIFDGYLYVGIGRGDPLVAELWRTDNGTTWSSVFTNGLGNSNNTNVSSMEIFEGQLYLGLRNTSGGGEVWRSSNGTSFSQVFSGGLGNSNNQRPYGLINYANKLYLVLVNATDGDEVWKSEDGSSWEQLSQGGWGDSNNIYSDYVDKAAAVYEQKLFIGNLNHVNGGEVWMYQESPTPTFTDVPFDYWAHDFIEALYNSGITSGCGGGNYCPGGLVTRAQMALFLERGIHGSDYAPPAASGFFDDVPTSYWVASWIEQLYDDGITSGCGGGNYCPNSSVTRAQMALFLLRSMHGASYSPPAASGIFDDVPTSYWAADWVEQLYEEGVTSGCGGGDFCPNAAITRAQMAVFLTKAFDLPTP
jgi:hypothetical protein